MAQLFQTKQHIAFRIQGENVRPDLVPLEKLLEALSCTNAIVKAMGPRGTADGLNLIGITKGSVTCEIAANEIAMNALQNFTETLASGDLATLPPSAKTYLEKLWKLSVQNNWDGYQFERTDGSAVLATIRSDQNPFSVGVFKGVTTVYGRCVRTGGERPPTAQIKQFNGKTIYAHLTSKELAEELGKRLYETVGLVGEATWDKSHSLIEFRADQISPYRDRDPSHQSPRTVLESFQDLADLHSDRWDDIDPNQFVNELRGE